MRRAFIFAVSVIAFFMLNPATQGASGPAKPLSATGSGDLTGDGALTIADQSLLCNYLLGKATLTTTQLAQADLNGDGNLDVADLVGLVNLSHPLTLNLPGVPAVPLTLAICPAGKFSMGRTSGELDSSASESPRHTVTFTHSVCMGKTEVTKRQWLAVMGTSPWNGQTDISNDPDSPAIFISWTDIAGAGGFIEKLNKHLAATGQPGTVRLPTEAEWEYTCRAGTTTRFYWGDDADYSQLGAYAWFEGNAQMVGQNYAHTVGLKIKNIWGLSDTIGNAWEWCQDFYGSYSSGAATDPTGPATGSERVVRGGSCVSPVDHCRAAYRLSRAPDFMSNSVSFRVAWTSN